MQRIVSIIFVILFALVGSGCTSIAPQYSASMENVQTLKKAGNVTANVAKFNCSDELGNTAAISLRASTVVSPYEGSYANYLAEAIKQELALAGKLAPKADVEISGVLLRNSVDASGVEKGYGDIEARFVVKKAGALRYDKTKTAHSEWESAFAGSVAIPRAKLEYSALVQKLLSNLYSDQEFIKALK